jgi:anti-sigma regulatory factor (Ser/Thr protein kinase)
MSIAGEEDLSRAVLEVSRSAREVGFDPVGCASLSTAASELGRNILKYADRGELHISPLHDAGRSGLEIVARDRGPGITDLGAALTDHHSTGGTLGLGLPGVKRLMDHFEIDTRPGRGTSVTIRKYVSRKRSVPKRPRSSERGPPTDRAAPAPEAPSPGIAGLEWAAAIRPCIGERLSGDAVYYEQRESTLVVALVDGLGHGPDAHDAATAATDTLAREWVPDAARALRVVAATCASGHGVVAGVAVIDAQDGALTYAGVGNVAARVLSPRGSRVFVSANGVLGQSFARPPTQNAVLAGDEMLVLHSDGVSGAFDETFTTRLLSCGPAAAARMSVRVLGRSHDDCGVLVVRWKR